MLNRAILMGRLTADPELRHTPNNVSVTSFTLAVDRSYARQGEQKQTDFIDIVCWRSTAEFVCRYFKKGMQVAVSGSIQTRNWEDRDGKKRVSVEVVADEVFFADSKRSDAAAANPFPAQAPAAPEGMNDAGFSPIASDDELPF